MLVHQKRACAVIFIAAGGSVMAPACAPNEGSMIARACLAVDDVCSVEYNPSTPFYSKGALDTAFASQYECALLVANQLVARGDPNKLRVETSRIHLLS